MHTIGRPVETVIQFVGLMYGGIPEIGLALDHVSVEGSKNDTPVESELIPPRTKTRPSARSVGLSKFIGKPLKRWKSGSQKTPLLLHMQS